MRSSGARPHARAALPALQWGVPYAPGCPYSRKYRHPDAHIYVNMGTPGCPYLRGVYIFMTPAGARAGGVGSRGGRRDAAMRRGVAVVVPAWGDQPAVQSYFLGGNGAGSRRGRGGKSGHDPRPGWYIALKAAQYQRVLPKH